MPHLSPQQKQFVLRECEGLTGRDRTVKLKELSMRLGCHLSSLYRLLPAADDRLRRADRGEERCPIPKTALRKMLALAAAKDFSANETIEAAELNGWIEIGAISEATFNRRLAKRQLSKQQRKKWIKPYTRFEERFSNERHYVDITGFPDYFVEPDGSIGYESALQASKNRPGNRQPRLQLFWIVDGYSRAQFGAFYVGKNALNWIDFLIRAWSSKENPYAFPFQGRPHDLYSDMEKIFFTELMTRFLKAMDVRYHHHEPGNSRAKGKVERPIGIVQKWLRHAFSLKDKLSLQEANDYLQGELLYKVNGRVHSTTHQDPMGRWRAGFPPQHAIRLMPDERITQRYFYTQDQRVIQGDLTVQLFGKKWQLPRKVPFINWSGQPVPVFYHPGEDLKAIYVVIDDIEYEIAHATPVVQAAGTYRKIEKSQQEKLLEELGAVDLSDIDMGGYRQRYATKTFLPVAGEELDIEALHLPRRVVSKLSLIQRLQADQIISIPPSPSEKAYLDSLHADGQEVYEDQLDDLIDALSGPLELGLQAAS